ncbi:hypothetical protein [Acetobacteroides hydrogenigenes]|uniref:Uncharacterized protein n=1 Tax=Acetobacteroides hydrogenigenes TaxID=979970 RepID=A0A4R2EJK9_9BACT|nr:hypothetical protein [Acetobacteroides hydrogenigenes]TCN68883.1 hypothetical protein CLV25_10585 [Acetobacteroides hydrogenigenes]
MKAIRYIIFIPIIFLIIATIYTLLPMALFGLMGLSNIWLIILLVFFGGLAVVIFQLLPIGVAWLSSKISPSEKFAYNSILTISILLSIVQIYGYWSAPNITTCSFGYFLGIMLTCLTIGFAASFSIGAGIQMEEEKGASLAIILAIGSIVFYIGIFLVFCLLSIKICYINPDKTYTWYSGILHGILVIPHWIISWFLDDIYCKAPNSTTAYSLWWWISFIFFGLIFLGGGRNCNQSVS